MLILVSDPAPPWPHRLDYGVLLLVAALFLAVILAHRFWRARIRLEDQLAALARDAARVNERYRLAFRQVGWPLAFVDRATGLVLEAAPGWLAAGLPETGARIFQEDPELEAAWRAIPGPDAGDRPAAPAELRLQSRAFRAEPLGGASLGVVLVTLR